MVTKPELTVLLVIEFNPTSSTSLPLVVRMQPMLIMVEPRGGEI
jgi:hypothetical protein